MVIQYLTIVLWLFGFLGTRVHHVKLSVQLLVMLHGFYLAQVDRAHDKFLSGVFRHLNNACELRRASVGGQPLSTHRLKVVFNNEPGEGSGVVRSFFTTFAEVSTTHIHWFKLLWENLTNLDFHFQNACCGPK